MKDLFTIVALGNSLTEGWGVAPWESYPARLQAALNRSRMDCHVVNAGISGDTCRGVLSRLDEVRMLEPDLVILEIGVNDILMGAQADRIQNNIRAIVERLQAGNIPVLLAGMELPPVVGEPIRVEFAAIYSTVARSLQSRFLPSFTRPLWDRPENLQSDGLHPTAEGYRAITDHVLPWVVRAVEELRAGQ
ncbi:MAG: arylesterase [Desulfobacteraceae bacterium]|nr:arylesterase [Desulfobacteraceae bacterium]